MSGASKRYKQVGDEADQLLRGVLAFRQICIDVVKRRTSNTASRGEDSAPEWVRNTVYHYEELAEPLLTHLDTLQEVRQKRAKADFNARESAYFWQVFPYRYLKQYAGKKIRLTQPENITFIDEGLSLLPHVYKAASDLVELDRLLNPLAKWKERDIFEKENEYADRVESSQEFQTDRDALFEDYPMLASSEVQYAWKAERDGDPLFSAVSTSSIRSLQKSYLDKAISDAEPARYREFIYQLTGICRRYCLRGLSSDKVHPELFSLLKSGTTTRIVFPHYLDIDFFRTFPEDVVKKLQYRPEYPDDVSPKILRTRQKHARELEIWALYAIVASSVSLRSGHKNTVVHVAAEFMAVATELEILATSPAHGSDKQSVLSRRLSKIAKDISKETLCECLLDRDLYEQLTKRLKESGAGRRTLSRLNTKGGSAASCLLQIDEAFLKQRRGFYWSVYQTIYAELN